MHYKVPSTVRGGLCVHRPNDDCHDLLVVAKKHKLTAAISGSNRKRARPEEEEHVLEYLELRHQGHVETAQLSLLVASFAGRGKLHNVTHTDTMTLPKSVLICVFAVIYSVPSSSISAQARPH
jgi:hypothetical protein